jgi:hypothetical protein
VADNKHIASRLAGIRQILMGAHCAGASMSTASRGTERAAFVNKFLSQVLTPQFRFGEGEATDVSGRLSGQLDVVVEYPWIASLPTDASSPRLYLAEGVAAVIEVKSDVAGQWDQVRETSAKLKALERSYDNQVFFGGGLIPPAKIPLFAVGYVGWKTMESVEAHLAEGIVDGILVIESGLFASQSLFGEIRIDGDLSLWGLICCLHQATSALTTPSVMIPVRYVFPENGS